MTVDGVKFEAAADAPAPEWTIRVTVTGSGFEARAALLRATVGGAAVEGIIPSPDGKTFVGWLRSAPPLGAPLVVGSLSSIDTGLTFEGTT